MIKKIRLESAQYKDVSFGTRNRRLLTAVTRQLASPLIHHPQKQVPKPNEVHTCVIIGNDLPPFQLSHPAWVSFYVRISELKDCWYLLSCRIGSSFAIGWVWLRGRSVVTQYFLGGSMYCGVCIVFIALLCSLCIIHASHLPSQGCLRALFHIAGSRLFRSFRRSNHSEKWIT